MPARVASTQPRMVRACSAGISSWTPSFGLPQTSLGRLQLIGEHQQSCIVHTQERACADQCLGQGVHPPEHRGDLTLDATGSAIGSIKRAASSTSGTASACCTASIGRSCCSYQALARRCNSGTNVGSALLQVAAQHLGKQVVVAVPAPLVVEGDHKQVRPVERFQHRLAPLLTRHRIAERPAEALQDRGVQEKRLHRSRLPREHLFGEVVQHIAMSAGEGSQKRGDIGSALQRERGQLQSCNPAFRAALEGGDGLEAPGPAPSRPAEMRSLRRCQSVSRRHAPRRAALVPAAVPVGVAGQRGSPG